jgi:hypothetical protein
LVDDGSRDDDQSGFDLSFDVFWTWGVADHAGEGLDCFAETVVQVSKLYKILNVPA